MGLAQALGQSRSSLWTRSLSRMRRELCPFKEHWDSVSVPLGCGQCVEAPLAGEQCRASPGCTARSQAAGALPALPTQWWVREAWGSSHLLPPKARTQDEEEQRGGCGYTKVQNGSRIDRRVAHLVLGPDWKSISVGEHPPGINRLDAVEGTIHREGQRSPGERQEREPGLERQPPAAQEEEEAVWHQSRIPWRQASPNCRKEKPQGCWRREAGLKTTASQG